MRAQGTLASGAEKAGGRREGTRLRRTVVLSGEEELCVFLNLLPHRFPWKTSTLHRAPFPTPRRQPFWQPGAFGKAALDTSWLPTLEATKTHQRGEERKSRWIFFLAENLLTTFSPSLPRRDVPLTPP